jgi:ubiquinone/menaquinone biosynthesis C-methylase UbiE
MSEDSTASLEARLDYEDSAIASDAGAAPPPVPDYCQETYWWAYLHPRAVWFFERPWVVNLILWGHMRRLTDAVLEAIGPQPRGDLLQVACVYGNFTKRLAGHVSKAGARLHLLDVAPIQLDNAQTKLAGEGVHFHHQDSTQMRFPDGLFESTVVFFLLHEQPEEARLKTIAEALRVTRPGGKLVFVDYHSPRRSNPLRYIMRVVLSTLEPFALDLWRTELSELLRRYVPADHVESDLYGGGLYQRVVVTRPERLDLPTAAEKDRDAAVESA